MNSMRFFKNKKILVRILVGIVALAAMAWYINTYIYQFLAAFPKVNVEVKPYSLQSTPVAITSIAPNQEFLVRVTIANQNIDAVDLFLTYDNMKVAYNKEYIPNYVAGSGYTQFPDQYFTTPIIEELTTVGNKKQLRLALMSITTERKNLIHLNFKFKALTAGTAQFNLESKSEIVGVDTTNNVTTFEKDPAAPSGSITVQTTGTTITPSTVTPTPTTSGPTATPASGNTLLGHWKMDDNVKDPGKTIVDSVGGNNGTTQSVNSPTGPDCTIAGKVQGSCSFDGVDDRIKGSTPFSFGTKATITAWVKGTTGVVFGSKSSPLSNSMWLRFNNGKAQGGTDFSSAWPNNSVTGKKTVVDGNWHHIAFVLDEGVGYIYVDGKLDGTDTIASKVAYTDTDGWYIGYSDASWTPGFFKGQIDDFRIYNYARNAGQIQEDMGTPNITVTPGVTISQGVTVTQGVSVTPSPSTGGNTKINMKIKFQGVRNPKPENNKVTVAVSVGSPESNLKKVEFTHLEGGIYTGTYENNLTTAQRNGPIYIKGPKHIRKKICNVTPTETIPGTYKCTNGSIGLKAGVNELDFSNIILLAGDLPQQDGIVNSLDFAFIRQNFGKTDAEALIRGDLNLDGIIHTDDHTLIKTALEFKYDEE